MTLVQKTLRNQKGLTLIELLAVVVILGIIAAIAVPAISNIIEDSRDKAIVSEAVNIINAAKIAQATGKGEIDDTGAARVITWNKATLSEYISNLKAENITGTGGDFSVTWTDADGYVIHGHAARSTARTWTVETDTFSTTTGTEAVLTGFLNGTAPTAP